MAALRLMIATRSDIEHARREARGLARSLGFGTEDVEAVGLAVSELATNVVRFAGPGELEVVEIEGTRGPGIQVVCRDHGQGIADINAALQDGFSTAGSLGGGLPGVRRLMDEFELSSGPAGTTVVCRKWLPTT